jgi:BASS family bile acid:Na+ symporter
MPSALMLLGLGLGLASGITFRGMGMAAMVALASLMTFSLTDVTLSGFGGTLRLIPVAIALSFLLHPALLLLAAVLTPAALWQGWVIMAAVPPAISIVPFTTILRGDVRLAVASTAVLYLLSLGLTPLIALLLLGVEVSPLALFLAVLVLILLPLLASRAVAASRWPRSRVEVLRNLSFAALTFFVGAANQRVILQDPFLAIFALAGSAAVVVAAFLLSWAMLIRVDAATRISLSLFSGYKNSGLAATIALALLSPAAVVAPTMMILFQILWIALLTRLRNPRG